MSRGPVPSPRAAAPAARVTCTASWTSCATCVQRGRERVHLPSPAPSPAPSPERGPRPPAPRSAAIVARSRALRGEWRRPPWAAVVPTRGPRSRRARTRLRGIARAQVLSRRTKRCRRADTRPPRPQVTSSKYSKVKPAQSASSPRGRSFAPCATSLTTRASDRQATRLAPNDAQRLFRLCASDGCRAKVRGEAPGDSRRVSARRSAEVDLCPAERQGRARRGASSS